MRAPILTTRAGKGGSERCLPSQSMQCRAADVYLPGSQPSTAPGDAENSLKYAAVLPVRAPRRLE